jgi:hypothetical protein
VAAEGLVHGRRLLVPIPYLPFKYVVVVPTETTPTWYHAYESVFLGLP